MTDKPMVLLVDDRPENLTTLDAVLESLEVQTHKASSADMALRFLLENEVAVILLDVEMPKIDGFETARLIRERPRSRSTPIIFITAFDSGQARIREGYKLGAVDYLVKPFQPDILRWKVSVFVELYRSREQERLLAHEQITRAEAQAAARRAELLAAAGATLASSMEEDPILEQLARRLVEEFADCAAILRPIAQGDMRLHPAQVFHKDQSPQIEIPVFRPENDPIKRAFQDGVPVLRESVLCLPLRAPSKALGVLALYRRATNPFTGPDLALARELSDRIALALANVALYNASEEANRAKDQFLAVVSHELRTPLVSILGWANILLSRKLAPDALQGALRTIQRNAKLQTNLINDILDFSRITSRQLAMNCQNVHLKSVIEQAIESITPIAEEKRVSLSTEIAEAPAVAWGDPVRLQQLFTNLLSNAIKFTPENGRVLVTLTAAGNFFEVQVSDTGIGIDPDFLPRIFEPFAQEDSTTTRAYSGLGLGLAIVRRLTELHNGSIRAESPGRGKGTTFILKFPVSAPDEVQIGGR